MSPHLTKSFLPLSGKPEPFLIHAGNKALGSLQPFLKRLFIHSGERKGSETLITVAGVEFDTSRSGLSGIAHDTTISSSSLLFVCRCMVKVKFGYFCFCEIFFKGGRIDINKTNLLERIHGGFDCLHAGIALRACPMKVTMLLLLARYFA